MEQTRVVRRPALTLLSRPTRSHVRRVATSPSREPAFLRLFLELFDTRWDENHMNQINLSIPLDDAP